MWSDGWHGDKTGIYTSESNNTAGNRIPKSHSNLLAMPIDSKSIYFQFLWIERRSSMKLDF